MRPLPDTAKAREPRFSRLSPATWSKYGTKQKRERRLIGRTNSNLSHRRRKYLKQSRVRGSLRFTITLQTCFRMDRCHFLPTARKAMLLSVILAKWRLPLLRLKPPQSRPARIRRIPIQCTAALRIRLLLCLRHSPPHLMQICRLLPLRTRSSTIRRSPPCLLCSHLRAAIPRDL